MSSSLRAWQCPD